MNYLKKILKYALPYKRYAILNIFFNILYALFSALSFVVLMPLLNVLFPTQDKEVILKEPIYNGITNLGTYLNDSLTYFAFQKLGENDKSEALLYVVGLVITTFLLKNLFNYIAMFFGTFLRNGILRDLRNDLYKKTISLPISFFSEKRKGDIISRISNDVGEVKNSFLAVLEMIVKEPLSMLFSIIWMLIISPKLTLFMFIFIPVSGYIIS